MLWNRKGRSLNSTGCTKKNAPTNTHERTDAAERSSQRSDRAERRVVTPKSACQRKALGAMSLGRGALQQNQSVMDIFWSLRHLILLLLLVTILLQGGLAQSPSSRPVQLKCDALVNPLGIDSMAPMLRGSFGIIALGHGKRPYEIQCCFQPRTSPRGKPDVWTAAE